MKYFKSCSIFCVLVAAAQLVSAQTVFNPSASRIVGQPLLQQNGAITAIAPNLVEGRELWAPQAIAVDTSVNPPILYVADVANNRVLAWKNALGFQKGDFADLVIGQRDKYSTNPRGPVQGSDLSTGLNTPSGVVVDKSGNLYVADTGNNRIIRYPTPFQQTGQLLPVDLIFGQTSITTAKANQGLQTPTAQTLNIAGQFVGMAFDSGGNLWVSDGVNNRILRYPASALATGAANDPAADIVLGQPDFVSTALPKNFAQMSKDALNQPGGLGFSQSGVLYVTDAQRRVLVYVGPFSSGQSAARIMGVIVVAQGAPQPSPVVISQTTFVNPTSVFFLGETPFVLDTGKSRILQFDAFSNWPLEKDSFSPLAQKAYGQSGWEIPGTIANAPNANQAQASDSAFAFPTFAAIAGSDLLVSDTGNNRVIAIPQFSSVITQSAQFPIFHANRVVGQVDFKYNSINLIEGREFAFVESSTSLGGGVALDNVSSTPHLYVADVFNDRVLGFKDSRTLVPGQTADLVIGQPDFFTAVPDFPAGLDSQTGNPKQVNDSSLFVPNGVAVDSKGDLWVADTGNGRVLRFPRPFDQTPTSLPRANLVIGQATLASRVQDASSQTMRSPYAIAFTANGDLVVSDTAFNRVLFFHKPSGGDFVSGQVATTVIGQSDFISTTTAELSNPRGIAIDPNNDRLYVADTGNSRILVYRNLPTAGNNPTPSIILKGPTTTDGFRNPTGVAVDQFTGECWVADTFTNRLVRFPSYDTLVVNPVSNLTPPLSDSAPIALTLDAYGNPVVAEGLNRVAFYYHAIGDPSNNCLGCSGNAANYFYSFAPGMLATIKPSQNSTFGTATATFSTVPVPTTLGDVQVIVEGVPAPLLYVSPSQINFQIPSSTPVGSNLVEIDVVKASTSQTLAAFEYKIDPFAPGLFTADATGVGQLSVVNQDNSINGSSHPAKAGSTISLYATGQGVVPGGPPDGTPASSAIMTPVTPRVLINLTDANVTYSGLSPGLLGGVWQINVVVPANVPPGTVTVVVLMNDYLSNTDPLTGNKIATTIRVTP